MVRLFSECNGGRYEIRYGKEEARVASKSYYDALGVSKKLLNKKLKRLIRSLPRSGIPMLTKPLRQRRNSKKQLKPMKYLVMRINENSTMKSCFMELNVAELVEGRRVEPPLGIQNLVEVEVEAGTVGLIQREVLVFRRKIYSGCFWKSGLGGSGWL